MPPGGDFSHFVAIASNLILCVSLYLKGILHSHRSLFALASLGAVRIAVSGLLDRRSNAYFEFWLATEILTWVIFVVLVLELHNDIFRQFPSLASVGRKVLTAAVGSSIAVAVLSVSWSVGPEATMSPFLQAALVMQRSVFVSLLLFLLALLASLVWFRVKLKRNTIVHFGVFFIYFLARVGMAVVRQSFGIPNSPALNMVTEFLPVICVLAWITLLTRSGESLEVKVGHGWNPQQGEKLLQRMEEMNAALSREARR